MSAETATTEAERDARALHDDGHPIAPAEIAIGVIIGRTSEFFDFFVYAIASVLVFPKLVFPHLDPLTGTLWSFAIFALAFAAGRAVHADKFPAINPAKNIDRTREWAGFSPWAMTENFQKLRSAFSYLKAFEEVGGTVEIK